MVQTPLTEDQIQALAELYWMHGEANGIHMVAKLIEDKYGKTHTLACDVRLLIMPIHYERVAKVNEMMKACGLQAVLSQRVIEQQEEKK